MLGEAASVIGDRDDHCDIVGVILQALQKYKPSVPPTMPTNLRPQLRDHRSQIVSATTSTASNNPGYAATS
jgi:hypothetical protein